MGTYAAPGYVRVDELQLALARGRLAQVFENTGLRLIGSMGAPCSLYGIEACAITQCGAGAALPDALRSALEKALNKQIVHRGPPAQYAVEISPQRVCSSGVGFGNWVGVRTAGGGLGVEIGIKLGIITDVEWRAPLLRLLGLDLDRKMSIYEYAGETSRG